ncbi:hypothetical protein QTP88_006055 [Uroleucon formosanum]
MLSKIVDIKRINILKSVKKSTYTPTQVSVDIGNYGNYRWDRRTADIEGIYVVKITCVGFLAVLGAFLNIVVLVMFYKKPSLRSPSNRFVGSLIASDLLSSTVLGPLLVSGIKTINKALIVFVATSTIFSILVIAMDRYTAVLSPLHYATNVTRQKSVLVIGTVWSISAALASPMLFKDLLIYEKFPVAMLEKTHGLVLLLIAFIAPCAALILVYFKMYVAAHSFVDILLCSRSLKTLMMLLVRGIHALNGGSKGSDVMYAGGNNNYILWKTRAADGSGLIDWNEIVECRIKHNFSYRMKYLQDDLVH